MQRIAFEKLKTADLFVDAVYESNGATNLNGDVLSKLMSVGTQGGFRPVNIRNQKGKAAYIVLESTNKHPDWLDNIDYESGIIQYYGDNREPGRELHDSKRGGNKVLRDVFEMLQDNRRQEIPPFFYFESEEGRNRRFLGLLVPGSDKFKPEELLVAIWRMKNGERYQNYKAVFTILDVASVSRGWLEDLLSGNGYQSDFAPKEWKKWIDKGVYTPLYASDSVLNYRTQDQQMPFKDDDKQKLQSIYDYFDNPYEFEKCAMKIVQLMDSNIHSLKHTRFVRDGGRDAIGLYRIGRQCDGVDVEFALEAKRYSSNDGIGVKEVSRLISRLRHRQFGILVTTSFVALQAYKEIKEDGHPIVIISGMDILRILYDSGIKTKDEIQEWLVKTFPKDE